MKDIKQTPNAEHRTPNVKFRAISDFDVQRSALGIRRLLLQP